MVDHDDRDESEMPPEPVVPLPPDPEGMNDARSGWAARAIRAFREATGTDEESALVDLLADLMHWDDRHHTDFEAARLRGREHYQAETLGEDGND
jgi:hypothetical protein